MALERLLDNITLDYVLLQNSNYGNITDTNLAIRKKYQEYDSSYATKKKEFERFINAVSSMALESERIKKIIVHSGNIILKNTGKEKIDGAAYELIKENLAIEDVRYVPPIDIVKNILGQNL